MKLRLTALTLVVLLALGLAACGKDAADDSSASSGSRPAGSAASSEEAAPESEGPASSPADSPSWEGSSGRPQSGTVTVVVEGEEETLPAVLFEGRGYSIYLPEEEWTRTMEGEGGDVQDVFTAAANDKVMLAVQSSSDPSITFDEVCETLLAEGYLQSDDDDRFFALSADGVVTCQYIVEGEAGTIWYLSWCYPDTPEYLEGWGSRIPQLIETFEAK